MGRLVRKPRLAEASEQQTPDFGGSFGSTFQTAARTRSAPTDSAPGDDYLTRAVKYVPAEVLGFFMLVNAILAQAMVAGGGNASMAGFSVTGIATCALVVGLILTPLFCWYVREDGDAWITNAVVSTIAFPFWAYLMGAVAFAKFHDGSLAAILIMTFTAVSGLAAPLPNQAKRQEQTAVGPKEGPRLVESLTA